MIPGLGFPQVRKALRKLGKNFSKTGARKTRRYHLETKGLDPCIKAGEVRAFLIDRVPQVVVDKVFVQYQSRTCTIFDVDFHIGSEQEVGAMSPKRTQKASPVVTLEEKKFAWTVELDACTYKELEQRAREAELLTSKKRRKDDLVKLLLAYYVKQYEEAEEQPHRESVHAEQYETATRNELWKFYKQRFPTADYKEFQSKRNPALIEELIEADRLALELETAEKTKKRGKKRFSKVLEKADKALQEQPNKLPDPGKPPRGEAWETFKEFYEAHGLEWTASTKAPFYNEIKAAWDALPPEMRPLIKMESPKKAERRRKAQISNRKKAAEKAKQKEEEEEAVATVVGDAEGPPPTAKPGKPRRKRCYGGCKRKDLTEFEMADGSKEWACPDCYDECVLTYGKPTEDQETSATGEPPEGKASKKPQQPRQSKKEGKAGKGRGTAKKAQESKPAKPEKKAKPKVKRDDNGKVVKVGVAATWASLFKKNEENWKAGKRDRKSILTDDQISNAMKAAFPDRESKVFEQVSMVRGRYIRGLLTKEKEVAHKYVWKGKQWERIKPKSL